MAFRLRPMRREDLSQVLDIDLSCFPAMMPVPNYQTELINPLAHYIVAFDDELTTYQENDYIIIGFAGLWMLAGEAHIINIAVLEAFRGDGLGELLLIGLIQEAQKLHATMITLEVRPSNIAAQQLYKKYGLSERGRRRAYYTDNREDAIIMTLDDPDSQAYNASFCALKQAYELRWQRDILSTNQLK